MRDTLQRVPGGRQCAVVGSARWPSGYADPQALETPWADDQRCGGDALREQNVLAALARWAMPPAQKIRETPVPLEMEGRLASVPELEELVGCQNPTAGGGCSRRWGG